MKRFLPKLLFVMFIILVIVYLSGTIFYENRYFPNTYINNTLVTNKTQDEVEGILTNEMKNYSLTIVAKDVPQEVIFGEEFDYKGEISENFYSILSNQNKYLWFVSLFNKKEESVEISYSYNKEKFKERLRKTNCIENENAISSEDAYIKKDKSGFRIINETNGTVVDFEKFFEKAINYVDNFKEALNLTKEDLYKKAEITKESEILLKELDSYNSFSNFVITYDFSDRKETLDFKTYGNWIDVDKNKNLVIDEEKIKEYVNSLSEKYDTLGDEILFKTTNSGEKYIKSISYGWKIDKQSTMTQLKELIENKETITIEPIYSKKAISRNENIIGNTYVEISIDEQRMWFYKDGELLVDTPIVTGLPTESRKTDTGIYYLVSRETNRYLGTYETHGYQSWVYYWMPFNGGQGIHDATWRTDSEFGGDTYLTNGSHGCVNTPLEKVKIIYENIKTGYPVIVY